jgi:hypothetical protein
MWSTDRMILAGENHKRQRKACPSATLSTTNLTWTGPEQNLASAVRNQRFTACALARLTMMYTITAIVKFCLTLETLNCGYEYLKSR